MLDFTTQRDVTISGNEVTTQLLEDASKHRIAAEIFLKHEGLFLHHRVSNINISVSSRSMGILPIENLLNFPHKAVTSNLSGCLSLSSQAQMLKICLSFFAMCRGGSLNLHNSIYHKVQISRMSAQSLLIKVGLIHNDRSHPESDSADTAINIVIFIR